MANVTGSYILRPTSYRTYRSSGTFSDWFYTSSSVTAPSTWSYKMDCGTKIGDNSDSTYYSDTGVSSSNSYAENAIMNLTVSSGTVPSVDYNITSVTLTYRAKASTTTDASRKLNIWNTIWYSGGNTSYTPTACINAGLYGWKTAKVSTSSVATATTSIANYTTTNTPSGATMPAGKYPDMHAICAQAYKTSALVSFSYWYLYEVWYVVNYSYDPSTTTTVTLDDGVTVSDGTTSYDATFDWTETSGTAHTLTATLSDGYVLDGWYDASGTLLGSATTLSYTFPSDDASIQCRTKLRRLRVGTTQAVDIYVGTTKVSAVYVGTTPVHKDSTLS